MFVKARSTAEVMTQLMRATSSLAFVEGLNPAQWAAIRYFAQAAPNARSVVAFARYHGTTKGTASQTIAALLKKGLLERQRSERDRRTVSLSLTPRGREILVNDPLNELAEAIERLDMDEQLSLARAVDHLFKELVSRRHRDTMDEEQTGTGGD